MRVWVLCFALLGCEGRKKKKWAPPKRRQAPRVATSEWILDTGLVSGATMSVVNTTKARSARYWTLMDAGGGSSSRSVFLVARGGLQGERSELFWGCGPDVACAAGPGSLMCASPSRQGACCNDSKPGTPRK